MPLLFVIFTFIIFGIFAIIAIIEAMRLLACGLLTLCFLVLLG